MLPTLAQHSASWSLSVFMPSSSFLLPKSFLLSHLSCSLYGLTCFYFYSLKTYVFERESEPMCASMGGRGQRDRIFQKTPR